MPTIVERAREIEQKRGELAKFFDDHRDGDTYNMTSDEAKQVRDRNDELTNLAKEWEEAKALEDIARSNAEQLKLARTPARPPHAGGDPESGGDRRAQELYKSLGQRFVESAAYKGWRGDGGASVSTGQVITVDIPDFDLKDLFVGNEAEAKTLMTTTAGWAPFNPRIPRVQLSAQRRLTVADLIPQDQTMAAAILFMEETTATFNAAPVAEGGTKPESAFVFTEQTSNVRVIATTLPVTNQQLDDVPQVRAVIDNRLTFDVQLEEEDQLVTGNGTAPNLRGYLNATGLQTQAKGADPTPTAFFKAITKVRFTGFADPSGFIAPPNDWQDIRTLTTADGIYIWGHPADPGPERMWGLPGIITPAITENTGLVGAFATQSQIWRKQGITIEMSNSHSDFFVKNQVMLRAEERLALVIYRGSAFCTITGI